MSILCDSRRMFSVVFVMTACMFSLASTDTERVSQSETANDAPAADNIHGKVTHLDMYRRLFDKHRAMQLDAVKSIQKFGDYTQRYQLLKVMMQQLFNVIEQAKKNLTEWGYMPGDPFPVNSTIRDAMSNVLENTAMFGDLVLRLPDMVHDMYDKNKEWQLTLAWGVWFCNESQIFEGSNAKLLNLMAQEVNLMPRDENYINPFKKENQIKEDIKQVKEKPKTKVTKKKKEIKRGPRLSGGGHTEL